jgi:hypothetical protein
MVLHITRILQRVTGEWTALRQPEALLSICEDLSDPASRDRLLTPITTMPLFL